MFKHFIAIITRPIISGNPVHPGLFENNERTNRRFL